ncbi:hypothetical protein BIV57_08740 [Mangrovactinospora gilvigrisea]|uniref:Transporter n=1 Tax=Mangrovactinospora gilvigrisea TaxID=1428644 RepID=A0A1J7CDU9_9ACTN|nr:phage holin family protein [Mangrovactinospora gilvigrisea]OIV37842.1 hypothetical protein BIV57_08740 [Mangrovactinospora gilvigrisea]
MSTAAGGRPGPDEERSLGQLFSSASEDLQGLIRDEIELAKAEMRGTVKGLAIGSGSFGAAAVLLVASVPMLSFAAAYGLRALTGWPIGWCFFGVFLVYLLLAAVLAVFGTRNVKKAKAPNRAMAQNKKTLSILGRAKPRPAVVVPMDKKVKAVEDRTSRPALDG